MKKMVLIFTMFFTFGAASVCMSPDIEIRENRNKKITAKGYSNWFDCKVKIFYNDKGQPYKAQLSTRLTLTLTFKKDECLFEN